jgi:hypothetical protein
MTEGEVMPAATKVLADATNVMPGSTKVIPDLINVIPRSIKSSWT